jgi:L(+)-tartrate dehydratase beta subunit
VRGFGPLLVGMDAHGGSIYDQVRAQVAERRAEILSTLGVKT